jgi:hypothetical protein
LFRAANDRTCPYLHRDTGNNNALAHMVSTQGQCES